MIKSRQIQNFQSSVLLQKTPNLKIAKPKAREIISEKKKNDFINQTMFAELALGTKYAVDYSGKFMLD